MKITQEQQKQGQEFLQNLIKRAWDDSSFIEELVASPKNTIEKIKGKEINLPKNTSIIVEDQTDASVIYLNIPVKPNFDEIELTDEQLELVAGGEILVGIGIGFAIVGLFAAGVGIGLAMK